MFTQLLAHAHHAIHFLVPFIIVISVIVFVHEFGHYWVARLCGIKIEAFSIGFGTEIFGWYDKHGTRWKVSWLPLGGYVKMFGDADVASNPDSHVHQMTEEEKKVSFFHQSVGKRIAVVVAGPAFNYLFAILVLTLLFMAPPFGLKVPPLLCHAEAGADSDLAHEECFLFQGQRYTPAVVGGLLPIVGPITPDSPAAQAGLQEGDHVMSINGVRTEQHEGADMTYPTTDKDGSVALEIERGGEEKTIEATAALLPSLPSLLHENIAAKAGFRTGDRILSIDNTSINRFEDVRLLVMMNSGTPIEVRIDRGGIEKTIQVTPEVVVQTDRFGGVHKIGRLGITSDTVEYRQWPFLQAIQHAVGDAWDISVSTLQGIKQMIMGTRSADELGGPLRIAQMSGHVSEDGPAALIHFMAMISINLGLINLFPIPMLDGGHLFFYLAEHLRGRPLHEKIQEIGMRIGMVLVLCLMVFATWNDAIQLGVISFIKKLFL